MATLRNIVIKTEPVAVEPPTVENEIVVKPEPLSPIHTPPHSPLPPTPADRRRVADTIAAQTEPLPTHPPSTFRRRVSDRIAAQTEPSTSRAAQTPPSHVAANVKSEPTSPKRARGNPAKLYEQLLALGDRGGHITNAEEFDCVICMATIEVGDGVRLRECLHEFCVDCTKNAILHSNEAEIPCPFGDGTVNCDSKILDLEIRAILTKEEYEKYLARSLRIAEGTMQNTVHCKVANCDGWCICDDNVNQFPCPKCNTVNCVSCQAAHDGRNCKQYQDDLKYAGLDGDTRRSQAYLDSIVERNLGMKCPKCQIIVMKRDGCDWLRCSMCRTEICWITKQARWGPRGQNDNSGGCSCRVNGKKCHPMCGNCH